MSAQDLKLQAVTRQADHPESFSRPSKLYEDMEALLSPKAAPLNDMLAASPRAEDRLEAALSKIGMLEDMDVQLRSQLEKIIVQRNQLGAEKAARNIEIQHLQAQVELLEADSAGRHHSDSRPGSPRESEPDRIASHVDSLQADNARLQLQVEISSHAVSDLQQQLHDSQQQLHSMSQDAVPSIAMSLESQLRAQVSKSEYEVARQAAQILELQGELTKVQVSYDKSAQRQTETNAQLTRQESTASRFAASNAQLQEQLAEAQITAASQENRIGQLRSSLSNSNASMVDAKQRNSQLEEELAVSCELSAEQKAEVAKLEAQLKEQGDKAAAESASRSEALAGVRAQLQAESAKQKEDQNALQQEVKRLQALAAKAQEQKESLQTEVQMLQSKQEEHQKLLAEQQTQLQVLGTELKAQTDAGTASEQQLQEMKDWLEQKSQQINSLTEQLSQAQAQFCQLQADKAQSQQQLAAEEASTAEAAISVSELKTQLSKAQTESAGMAEAHKQLQQQLGERTIVLGQKAHEIALLTAQLNEACSSSTYQTSQGGNSILSQGKQLSSAQVPADSTTAAGVKPAGHTNPAEKNSQHMVAVDEDSLRHDAVTAEDAPITPFQPQPSQPQHSLYTSDSDSRSHCHPSPTTKSASKPTGSAMDRSDASQTAIRPSTLEAQFMKSSRGTSSELGSELSQQQPQLQPAVAKPESRPEAFSDQLDSQLSPPQSRPSSPESQTAEDTDNDSNDHAVTHVNGYFDKSDEDNISSSSMPDLSDQDTENEGKGEEEAGCVANGSRNRSHLRAAARSLEGSGDTLPGQHEADSLRSQLADTQASLRAVTQRAESAETDLKAALVALEKAEMVLDKLVYRKDVAELVGLVSGCIAAFLGAAGMTVYLLQ
ncbi:TPA: hypothetical protein ACH3X2_006652 [Trebouxia sp. C0005]